MGLLRCFIYLLITGLTGFAAGRLLPPDKPDPKSFVFRCFGFERNGHIYEKLGIRKWQKLVPDMSRVLPGIMPRKKLEKNAGAPELEVMIHETCVAEAIHVLLSITGLVCLRLWRGLGGIVVTLVYILLGNIPFILIQRFNRPRLVRLLGKMRAAPVERKELEACGY